MSDNYPSTAWRPDDMPAADNFTERMRSHDDASCLREFWDTLTTCDFAGDTDEFVERMESAGLIVLVPVNRSIMAEDPFASELGLNIGGECWQLTAKGRKAYDETGAA
jgi:hypothetical protein